MASSLPGDDNLPAIVADLRSDTVTRPSDAMRRAMAEAPVGDDVFGDDPTVAELEAEVAGLLGMEAAVYVPSGTQSNLLALLAHCQRGDEYIVGQQAHTYRFEGGGAAVLGSIQPQPLDANEDGTLNLTAVRATVKPDDSHFARTRLLCFENTHQGHPSAPEYYAEARALGDELGLAVHLDGARLFNACTALGVAPTEFSRHCHSVSVCLSKGLGAPVGSVLAGHQGLIQEARKWRKMLGGGMRQAGIIAAGGLYAVRHHIQRLGEDHQRAEALADTLRQLWPDQVRQQTNMIFLDLDAAALDRVSAHLRRHGVQVGGARWVLHLDITDEVLAHIQSALRAFTD